MVNFRIFDPIGVVHIIWETWTKNLRAFQARRIP